MIFDAKCKSFKIFVVVLGLIGSTLVADCQAERNPVSPESLMKQGHLQAVFSNQAVARFEAFKQERERNEKRWNELKQFVGQQATAASDKFASSGLSDWWTQPASPAKKPVVRQQAGDDSIAISPSSLLVKLAGHMSAIGWWQISRQTIDLFESAQQRVVQTSTKFQAEFKTSLLLLAKSSSSHVGQKVNDLVAYSLVQGVFVIDSEQMAAKLKLTEVVNEATSGDSYWNYYSDCDFWGAEFIQVDQE